MKINPVLLKRSVRISFSIIAGISTIAGIWGYTIKDICPSWEWWKWGLILIACFFLISFFVFFIISKSRHLPYKTTINGKPVVIKTGDIFNEKGWKLIPFNDSFDTQVDDIIISHNSLNGQMIDNYVDDIDDINNAIVSAKSDPSTFRPLNKPGKLVYPLGRIIPYKDFLMLAFSHFDRQNMAYLGLGEYESMLFSMWIEVRRVYAAKPISIPLLGTGITTIAGDSDKDYTDMLKCILGSLKKSKFRPENGISIVLTKEAMEKIDMSKIREDY